MIRLLIHEAACRPIAGALEAYGAAIDPLVMGDDGVITLAGAVVDSGQSRPDIAWLSGGLYFSGAMRSFVGELFKAPDLKWVQSAAAGFDHPLFGGLIEKGVRLSTSHTHAEPIADYVLAAVLDHFQRGPERRDARTRGDWARLTFREMAGSRWLIVGFGAIGQAVARRARAFDARIIGVRRTPSPHPAAERVISLDKIHEVLPSADVVVLSAPLNPDTRHLADARFFGAMKPGAVLVNVGRGALVHEMDLMTALDHGVPAHAVLDVFETEPLTPDNPFWRHPRVSLTAHTAGETDAVDQRNEALFLDNLSRYLAGKPLLNVVEAADVLASR